MIGSSRMRFVIAAAWIAAIAPIAYGQSADLTVTKTGPDTSPANSDVPYSVTITNNGPDPAASATLTDNIPGGMTFVSKMQNNGPPFTCTDPGPGFGGTVSCTIASLAAGGSANFTFVFHIPSGTPDGTTFTNIATVFSDTPDPLSENNSAATATSTPFPPQADIFVTKSGPTSAGPGTNVTFTITLTNPSTNAAQMVTLQDTLPGTMTFVSWNPNPGPMTCTTPAPGGGGTINCSTAVMAAGASFTYTLVGQIPTGTPSGTVFSNTATISSSNDPNTENNSGTDAVTVSLVDVSVTKIGPATVTAGNPVTYTITVSNGGPDIAMNVVMNDPLPAGTTFISLLQNSGPTATCSTPGAGANGTVTCGIPQLNSGASAQFTLVVSVGNVTSITNTASVTTDSFDTNTANNTSSVTTTVTPSADLAVTKTDTPDPVLAGNNITYTINVTNNGPSDATSVSLTDAIPASTTFVSFTAPAGWMSTTPAVGATGNVTSTNSSLIVSATATFTLVVQVNAATPVGTTITNTASVSSAASDPNAANNSAAAMTLVAANVSDLSITKTASPSQPAYRLNVDVTFTITVTNGGPNVANSVTVTDTLPANMTFVSATPSQGTCSGTSTVTCSVGTMASGATATITIIAHTASVGPATNTATVSSTSSDPNPANNTAVLTLAIVVDIPTLSPLLLALLAGAFAAVALRLLTE